MVFDWDEKKNKRIKSERGLSFERVVIAIEEGHILDILEHPKKDKYKDQLLIIVEIDDYAYVVPAVVSCEKYHLKTVFPSRKYTDKYLPGMRGSI
jgi:uncharacterized DUF497 family protein